QHVDLGFNPDNLVTMKMVLPASKYSQYRQRVGFADQVLERVQTLPGVASAGMTTNIPLEREISYDAIFNVEGGPPPNPNNVPITSCAQASIQRPLPLLCVTSSTRSIPINLSQTL